VVITRLGSAKSGRQRLFAFERAPRAPGSFPVTEMLHQTTF
jgi:hypothetical protein